MAGYEKMVMDGLRRFADRVPSMSTTAKWSVGLASSAIVIGAAGLIHRYLSHERHGVEMDEERSHKVKIAARESGWKESRTILEDIAFCREYFPRQMALVDEYMVKACTIHYLSHFGLANRKQIRKAFEYLEKVAQLIHCMIDKSKHKFPKDTEEIEEQGERVEALCERIRNNLSAEDIEKMMAIR